VVRRKSSSLAIPARQPFDINGYFRRVSQAVDPLARSAGHAADIRDPVSHTET
jgi:hypothetical protein